MSHTHDAGTQPPARMTTAIICRVRSTPRAVAFRDMTILPAGTPAKDAMTTTATRTGPARITPLTMSGFWSVANPEPVGTLVRRIREASEAVQLGSGVLNDRT